MQNKINLYLCQTKQTKIIKMITISKIQKMENKLTEIGFFVGGLTDEGIIYYFNKMKNENRIK